MGELYTMLLILMGKVSLYCMSLGSPGVSGKNMGGFSVSLKNLRNVSTILVHYVFLVRHNEEWTKPIIIRQDYLLDLFENKNVGSEANGNIVFYFSYNSDKTECSEQDFTKYIRDFVDFPKIEH